EGLAAASPTEEVPGEEVLLTHGSGLRDPRSVSGADLIVEQPDEGVERGVEGGGPGAVDPFAVPAAVILLVFEEPVDVLLIKQFAPDALVGHTGARGLPDLRRRAEEITFDLPAQGGSESSSQSASRASTIVDPLHPVTSRTGGDLGQRLLLRAEA